MARVVYTGVNDKSGLEGSLFQGQKFWFSQKVPQRQWFMEQVQSNGGVVVPLEKQADIKLVDHTRKDLPPDTYSYTYVEVSIRNGELQNLKDHTAGPPAGTIRSAGSTTLPAKGTRNPYTKEDDQVLWDWVTAQERKGGHILGNQIYKQLEEVNPQHPWQSWRDRWVKTLSSRPRPTQAMEDAPPTPPADRKMAIDPGRTRKKVDQSGLKPENKKRKVDFTPEDAMTLLDLAEDILDVGNDDYEESWEAWAKANPDHTAEQWRDFFERTVLPIHKSRSKKTGKDRQKVTQKIPVSASTESSNPKTSNMSRMRRSPTSSPMPSRVKKLMSPLFEPESPRLKTKQHVESQRFRTPDISIEDVRSSVSEAETSLESPSNEPVKRNVPPKRKRVNLEDVPCSSPPEAEVSTPNKRARHRPLEDHITEIPSTPERGPMQDRNFSGSQADNLYEVVDLGGEDDADVNALGMPASQSLSEPDQSGQTTQQVFQDPSQILDLELPAPEGGWEDELFLAASAAPPTEILDTQQQSHTVDTQILLTGQTQIPDFSVPEPDGGWDTLIPSSPALPESTQPAAEKTAKEDLIVQLNAFIQKHIARGLAPASVTLALKSTGMDIILAKAVLESLMAGKGIPKDVPGVWTEEDDEDLRANDSRWIKRVQDKHGAASFGDRWTFLDDYEAVP